MADNLRDIRRRIKSNESTQKITQAMKLVASVRLRKAQDRAQAARPYAESIRQVLTEVASKSANLPNPLLQSREVHRVAYVVLTSDRGLCGPFNTQVLRRFQMDQAESPQRKNPLIFVVGRKGRDYLRRRNYEIGHAYTAVGDEPGYALASLLSDAVVKAYLDGTVDEVRLVYAQFVTAMTNRPVGETLLPLAPPTTSEKADGPKSLYLFEPDEETVLDALLPQYLTSLIFRALLESKASEFGAKMTAMDSATRAARDLIKDLVLLRNRARQAAITKELAEIVGGAAALE